MSQSHSDLVLPNTWIKEKWIIGNKIGGGGFGEIYIGVDNVTREEVAIKCESNRKVKQVLKMEVAVLKKLQGTSRNVCRFLGCGRHERFNYLVMTLQGKNLAELRRSLPYMRFSLRTTMLLLKQVLSAVETVHNIGFLHRDIKPSNFAIGSKPETQRTVYILDFGLSRLYLNSRGEVRPPRRVAGFRGTVRYASANAHKNKDLGRVDDLWSVFYMTVEFLTSQLPWRRIREKEEVGRMKSNTDYVQLIRPLPPEFSQFLAYIQALSYEDRPDYRYLEEIVSDIMNKNDIDKDDPYDWEIADSNKRRQSTGDCATQQKANVSGTVVPANAVGGGNITNVNVENTATTKAQAQNVYGSKQQQQQKPQKIKNAINRSLRNVFTLGSKATRAIETEGPEDSLDENEIVSHVESMGGGGSCGNPGATNVVAKPIAANSGIPTLMPPIIVGTNMNGAVSAENQPQLGQNNNNSYPYYENHGNIPSSIAFSSIIRPFNNIMRMRSSRNNNNNNNNNACMHEHHSFVTSSSSGCSTSSSSSWL